MHELAITQTKADAAMEGAGPEPVTGARLRVGRPAGVVRAVPARTTP
jgi:hypothetical protein